MIETSVENRLRNLPVGMDSTTGIVQVVTCLKRERWIVTRDLAPAHWPTPFASMDKTSVSNESPLYTHIYHQVL